MSKVIPTRICPLCLDEFTPIPHRDRATPIACRSCSPKWHGLQRKGQPPTAAIAARKRQADARMYDRLQERFGELSAREQAIVQAAERQGYARGYAHSYHKQHLRKRTEAA